MALDRLSESSAKLVCAMPSVRESTPVNQCLGTLADKGKTDKYSFFARRIFGCARHSRRKHRSALAGAKIRRRLKKEDLSRLLVIPFSSVDKSLTL